MTTTFPNLKPSSRQVTAGQYAVKRFTTISGTGTSRVYSSQPFNASMDLSFNNINDEATLSLLTAYEEARGSYGTLQLPEVVWEGTSYDLRQRLERDYTWRFATQPQVSAVAPGVSSVSVQLEGQRDG